MSELAVIKNIEKLTGKELSVCLSGEFKPKDSYWLNSRQQVAGLKLNSCQISTLGWLKNLPNLTYLNLSNNQLSNISGLKNLPNLTYLDLSNNQLSNISGLKNLPNLTYLNLSDNQLSNISWLKNLPNITQLILIGNKINDISALKELNNITLLVLWGNQLTTVPEWILNFNLDINSKNNFSSNSNGIYLLNNPLEDPPSEIIELGNEAIKAYFNGGERKAINEVKIILVGDGGSGKTSLSKVLRSESFDHKENQTHGINIFKQNIDGVTANFWDFGGQEMMHATHQFFLSKRSLYILVLDSREEDKAEYWLKYIESFGGNSPILIVLNKIDQNPSFDVNRKFLQNKYKSIQGFYKLSCANNIGLDLLKTDLLKAFKQVPLIHTKLPKTWFTVKTNLENLPEQKNFIDYQAYRSLCKDQGIYDSSVQDILAQYLNDLGVIIHFTDPQLMGTPVLKPRWITQGVYKIINFKSLSEAHGLFYLNELPMVLSRNTTDDFDYPCEKYHHIIELMKKFEICYEVDRQHILIPDLLEIQEPDFRFDCNDVLRFRIRYDFLSKLIMPRFIVKRHLDIKDTLRWRTGVILEDKNLAAVAVVKVDYQEKLIDILVNGTQKRDYFSVIRKTFNEIHVGFDSEKFKFTELVPLSDNPYYEIKYQELIGYEKSGRDDYFHGELEKSYRVSLLLNGIEKPESRIKEGNTYNIKEVTMGNKTEVKGNVVGSNIGGHDIKNIEGRNIYAEEKSQVQQFNGNNNTATQSQDKSSEEKEDGLFKKPLLYIGIAFFLYFITIAGLAYDLQKKGKLSNKIFKEIILHPVSLVEDIFKEEQK